MTLPDEEDFGELHLLCDTYWECLAHFLNFYPPASPYDTDDFDHAADTGDVPPPALRVFKAFEAKVAVIERGYFDQDYRSEFGAVHETTFTAAAPDVIRVHFFDVEPPAELLPMRDFVAATKPNAYRGYAIIRPQVPNSSVGRAMVAPARSSGPLREGLAVADRVRTAVVEDVNLFGVQLQVHGVPFMEQDGHLLRCAHVVSWMAHYTAVLKGVVGRVPSGRLNKTTDAASALGRPYPSPGAGNVGYTSILGRLGLPPEYIEGRNLGLPRPLEWYDNKPFTERVLSLREKQPDAKDGPPKQGADEQADIARKLWATNNLTSTLCRYLNSGIPCIVNFGTHSVLVCGYFRERDRADGDPSISSVAGFFVQDDQAGPFSELTVEKVATAMIAGPAAATSIIVPLPQSLWLSGHKAESAGAALFRGLIRSLGAQVAETGGGPKEGEDVAEGAPHDGAEQAPVSSTAEMPTREQAEAEMSAGPQTGRAHAKDPDLARIYEELLQHVDPDTDTPSGLTIRSYAMDGADFKVDFAQRVKSPNAMRIAGYVPMPKYVWITEVLDRDLHRAGKPPVIATVVLDGSASSYDPTRQPTPLLVHLPGLISRLVDFNEGNGGWFPTSTEPYPSGRWSGAADGLHLRASSRARRAKGAHL